MSHSKEKKLEGKTSCSPSITCLKPFELEFGAKTILMDEKVLSSCPHLKIEFKFALDQGYEEREND